MSRGRESLSYLFMFFFLSGKHQKQTHAIKKKQSRKLKLLGWRPPNVHTNTRARARFQGVGEKLCENAKLAIAKKIANFGFSFLGPRFEAHHFHYLAPSCQWSPVRFLSLPLSLSLSLCSCAFPFTYGGPRARTRFALQHTGTGISRSSLIFPTVSNSAHTDTHRIHTHTQRASYGKPTPIHNARHVPRKEGGAFLSSQRARESGKTQPFEGCSLKLSFFFLLLLLTPLCAQPFSGILCCANTIESLFKKKTLHF
uniref:Uncharacterized protein n=1 Tax=Anopheles quadriannulatus TaxID=34691 RepID=A0A182XSI5_ANOQN